MSNNIPPVPPLPKKQSNKFRVFTFALLTLFILALVSFIVTAVSAKSALNTAETENAKQHSKIEKQKTTIQTQDSKIDNLTDSLNGATEAGKDAVFNGAFTTCLQTNYLVYVFAGEAEDKASQDAADSCYADYQDDPGAFYDSWYLDWSDSNYTRMPDS